MTPAERLLEAARGARAIAQLTRDNPALTVDEAYTIQAQLVHAWRNRGASLVGYKAGLTSLAKQREMGVGTPIFGQLISFGAVENGGAVDRKRFIHPRAEPEVAFVLAEDLMPGSSQEQVRRAIRSVHLAVEIVDSRYEDFRFTLPDVVADNCSAAGYVLGPPIERSVSDLALLGVWIRKNGELVHSGAGAAALGDPVRSVAALAGVIRGGLHAGALVLTGGLTASVPFEQGDWIEVECGTGAAASFKVT